MRRSLLALATTVTVAGATLLLVSASASVACPSGDVCVDSNDAGESVLVFDLGGGTFDVSVLDFNYDGAAPQGHAAATVGNGPTVVNNTSTVFTSEGHFVARIPGILCVYVPDANDEQSPGDTQNLTDGQAVNAIKFAPTAAQANSISITAPSNCR